MLSNLYLTFLVTPVYIGLRGNCESKVRDLVFGHPNRGLSDRTIIHVQVAPGSRPVAAGVKGTLRGNLYLDTEKSKRVFSLFQRRDQRDGKTMAAL